MFEKEKQNWIEVRLITGEQQCIPDDQLLGYCHCSLHRGALTEKYIRAHECLGKNCRYFEKVEGRYWQKKEERRQKQKNQKQKEIINKLNEQLWQTECQLLAEKLGYPMKILRVKRTDEQRHFVIFYISDRDDNDFYRFIDLAKSFGYKYSAYAELRHAKDAQGNYAIM